MPRYRQSTGELFTGIIDGAGKEITTTGYSGRDAGRNNPAMQAVRGVGPIPRGRYTITGPECVRGFPCAQCGGVESHSHGPFVLRLHPQPGTEMFGRDGFLVHGDNQAHTASHGCIIVGRMFREAIAPAGNDPALLEVIE